MLGSLQLLHSRRSIRDVLDGESGPLPVENDSLTGMFNQDHPRDGFLRRDLESAVRQIIVGYAILIQDRGLEFLQKWEG